jgi:AAA15 family ATPase/GTPase
MYLEEVLMLFRFRTRNFRSIREAAELSLVASNLSDLPEAVIQTPFAERGALRAAAIYGPNASGKSNLLLAMKFMSDAVENSQRSWSPEGVPRERFLLDEESANNPSLFEADIAIDNVRYIYGFEVDSQRVVREWLHAYPSSRRRVLFERDGDDFTFGKHLGGENSTIRALVRANSLFLSAAAQNNHEQLLPIYHWFSSAWSFVFGDRGDLRNTTARTASEDRYKKTISRLVAAADLGIEGFETRDEPVADNVKRIHAKVLEAIPEDLRFELPATFKNVAFVHRCANMDSISLPLAAESEGTLAYFGLLGPVLMTLSSGRLLFIDEITMSLHPLLAMQIVRLFNSPVENPKGAQLLFTTHDTSLLDGQLLRRDQVWLTEKDEGGGTHLYPLTEFKPRRGENIRTGYLQGRYGAVPLVELSALSDEAHETSSRK